MHRILVVPVTILVALGLSSADAGSSPEFSTNVQPFLKKNCLACHNDRAKVGGLGLAGYQSTEDMVGNRDLWERVSERIRNGEMPPKGMPRPAAWGRAHCGFVAVFRVGVNLLYPCCGMKKGAQFFQGDGTA